MTDKKNRSGLGDNRGKQQGEEKDKDQGQSGTHHISTQPGEDQVENMDEYQEMDQNSARKENSERGNTGDEKGGLSGVLR